jgi:hypothetical protein
VDRIDTLRGASALRLAALAAALALASPAQAATKPVAKATTAAPSAAPAAAASPKATVAPAPAPPTRAPAAPVASAMPARFGWFGGSIGALNAFGTGKSILAQIDYGVLRTPPGWDRFDLEWHVVGTFAAPSGDKSLDGYAVPPVGPGPIPVNAGQEKVKALLFEVVPTARVLWTATRGVAFFGDAGLGLVQTFESYDRSELYMGHSTHNEYATGFVLHLGMGMAADVAPRWRVVLAPLAFDLMVGPKFSSWTPSLGVAYRL